MWYNAIKDETDSLEKNRFWHLVGLPNETNAIDFKWVFKIKRDSLSNIKRYLEELNVKGKRKELIMSDVLFYFKEIFLSIQRNISSVSS